MTMAWLSSSGALSACLILRRSAPTDHDWGRSSSATGLATEVVWHRAIRRRRPATGQRARYVPYLVSPGGDSRSVVANRAKVPQIRVLAGRPRGPDETSAPAPAGSLPVTHPPAKPPVRATFSRDLLRRRA